MYRWLNSSARCFQAHWLLGFRNHSGPASVRRLLLGPALARRLAAVGSCIAILIPGAAWAQKQIGAARIIVHDVSATRILQPEPVLLSPGRDVRQNDVVDTQRDSAALLVFEDGTGIGIAPQSEVVLDRVVYNPPNPQVKILVASGRSPLFVGLLTKNRI